MLRTGAPWRDLPPELGDWRHTRGRFIRWRDKGLWEKLLERVIDEPDYEGRMREASPGKVQPHAAGAVGGNQDMSRAKGGATQNGIRINGEKISHAGIYAGNEQFIHAPKGARTVSYARLNSYWRPRLFKVGRLHKEAY